MYLIDIKNGNQKRALSIVNYVLRLYVFIFLPLTHFEPRFFFSSLDNKILGHSVISWYLPFKMNRFIEQWRLF